MLCETAASQQKGVAMPLDARHGLRSAEAAMNTTPAGFRSSSAYSNHVLPPSMYCSMGPPLFKPESIRRIDSMLNWVSSLLLVSGIHSASGHGAVTIPPPRQSIDGTLGTAISVPAEAQFDKQLIAKQVRVEADAAGITDVDEFVAFAERRWREIMGTTTHNVKDEPTTGSCAVCSQERSFLVGNLCRTCSDGYQLWIDIDELA